MRAAAVAGWYVGCLLLAVPWWMLLQPAWSVFVLAGLMTLVAFVPGREQQHRMRGAFLWLIATVVSAVAVLGIALP